MIRTAAISVILLALTASAAAQTATFRWKDEACRYSGVYDPRKVTLEELRNTLKLLMPGSYNLETNTTVWKFDDVDRLNVSALEREYKQKSGELATLKIVQVPYWQEFRKRKLLELGTVYRLSRTTMLGYKDPNVLLEYKDAPACMTKFGEPLIKGGDSLLAAWLEVNEEARKKNVDPDRLRRTYEQQSRSPDRLRFAFLEVMTFGWANCANDLIPYVEFDGTPEQEFQKLFVRVNRLGCDEP